VKRLIHLSAILEGLKKKVEGRITAVYHALQRSAEFVGFTRIYTPYQEDGQRANTQPPEKQPVKANVRMLLAEWRFAQSELLDRVFQQDVGNQQAKGTITVGEKILAKDVPVSFLLYYAKRLSEWRTKLLTIPTLAVEIDWVYDQNIGMFRSKEPVVVQRTAKLPNVLTKAEATERHPAQTEVYYTDSAIGQYERTEFSGAERVDLKTALLTRVDMLIEATKFAIESANADVVVKEDKIADPLFDYLFEPITAVYGPMTKAA
jgi:hypothetical protein